jgi:transcriptional regulator with XRE-family HTH domain
MRATDLAAAAGVDRTELSRWETGVRPSRQQDLGRLRVALPLTDLESFAMRDMWRGAAAITDGMSRTSWWHNFPPPSRPVWIWVRLAGGAGGTLSGRAWWGEPFQGRLSIEAPLGGVFISAPTSIPNPGLHLSLDVEGWVVFGIGTVPSQVATALGAIVINGTDLVEPTPAADPPIDSDLSRYLSTPFRALRAIVEKFHVGWHVVHPHLGIARSDRAPQALDGDIVGSPPSAPIGLVTTDKTSSRMLSVVPAQLQALREARGLSRPEVAAKLSELDPDHPVTDRMVEHLENSGRIPATSQVVARLDHVYETDGRLGVEVLGDTRTMRARSDGDYEIQFPWYWVGPVWLQVNSSANDRTGDLELRWGHWKRHQRVRPGAVVTTRKAVLDGPPLRVGIPTDWYVTYGVGASPTALDINRGWWPVGPVAAAVLLRDNLHAVSGSFNWQPPRFITGRRRRHRATDNPVESTL